VDDFTSIDWLLIGLVFVIGLAAVTFKALVIDDQDESKY
jgi:hypothetical protein